MRPTAVLRWDDARLTPAAGTGHRAEPATVDVAEASGVDTCFYDLVGDDDFILGPVPGAGGVAGSVFVGAGWRGTGYKFAPWVGRVLAQLAVSHGTVYNIGRFAPGRFAPGVQTAGAQTAGAQTAAAQTAAAQTAGAQTAGAQTAGAQTGGTAA